MCVQRLHISEVQTSSKFKYPPTIPLNTATHVRDICPNLRFQNRSLPPLDCTLFFPKIYTTLKPSPKKVGTKQCIKVELQERKGGERERQRETKAIVSEFPEVSFRRTDYTQHLPVNRARGHCSGFDLATQGSFREPSLL